MQKLLVRKPKLLSLLSKRSTPNTSTSNVQVVQNLVVRKPKLQSLFSKCITPNALISELYWYSDGTFKVCPSLFAQVFTIHGLVKKIAFPFVYALLPNKEEASYQSVFQVLKHASANFNIPLPEPETLISDFELAIINAGIAEYLHFTVRLCFFHLGQSAYR